MNIAWEQHIGDTYTIKRVRYYTCIYDDTREDSYIESLSRIVVS